MGGKKSGGLFENWLIRFATTVFSQSFHAIFMVVILNIIAELQNGLNGSNKELVVAVITFGGILALTRLEKLVKEMLGLQDGMEGGLGGNFHAAMHGLRAGTDLVKRTAEPLKKYSEGKRQLGQVQAKIDRLKGVPEQDTSDNAPTDTTTVTDTNSTRTTPQVPDSVSDQTQAVPVSDSLSSTQLSSLISSLNTLSDTMNQTNRVSQTQLSERKQERLEDLESQKAKLERDIKNSKYERYTRLATTGVALGMAAGGSNGGINETLQMANAIDTVMDAATDKMVARF